MKFISFSYIYYLGGGIKVPWYKLDARHGPGHQTRTVEYFWRDISLSVVGKNALMNTFLEHENPVGTVSLVRKLPNHIRVQKIREYRSRRSYATKMLRMLENV